MKHALPVIWNISYKVWLGAFVISGVVCVAALRDNNQTMSQLRTAVYTADRDNGDVNTALNNLSGFVFSHMNTSLDSGSNIRPPIQLKYTYQRLYDAQYNQLQAENQKIYSDAKNACPGLNNGYDAARIACVQNYAVNHGVSGANVNIPAGLYEFDFVSPTWSPDLAGWGLVVSVIFFVLFVARFTYHRLAE